MPKRREPEKPGVPEWVMTYGDLMSLLLCFFILLAAFSELKQPREYRRVIDNVKEILGSTGGVGTFPNENPTQNSFLTQKDEVVARDESQSPPQSQPITAVVGPKPTTNTVRPGERFAIGATLEFAAGSATLSRGARDELRDSISPLIRDLNFAIEIRGHAFGLEDRAAGDLDDLSYARAKAVKDFLVEECAIRSTTLFPVACADREPAHVRGTAPEELARNRRVQVIRTEVLIDQLHPDPHMTGRGASNDG